MSDNWSNTFSNRVFEPADPKPESIDLASIAWALSRVARYGGHSRKWWSVANHSVTLAVLCHRMKLPIEYQRAAVLHDACEAYNGDMVRSMKNLLPEFKPIENRIQAVIEEKYGLSRDPEIHRTVKHLDLAIIKYECEALFPQRPLTWNWEKAMAEGTYPVIGAQYKAAQLIQYYGDRPQRDGYNHFLTACRCDPVLKDFLEKGE